MSSKENETQDGSATQTEQDLQFMQAILEPHCNTTSSSLLMESINRGEEGAFVASNTGNNYLSAISDAIIADENLVCDQGGIEPKQEDGAAEEARELESIDLAGEVATTTSERCRSSPSYGGSDGPIDPSLIFTHTIPQPGPFFSFDSFLDGSPIPNFGVPLGNTSDRQKEIYDELVQLLQSSNSDHDGQTSTPPPITGEGKSVGVDGVVKDQKDSEEDIVASLQPVAVEVMRTTERDTKEVEDSFKDNTKGNWKKRSNLGEMAELGKAKKAKNA